MRCELGHDPDVIQIAAILNIDEFAVVGRLHAVWSWLDQHSESGTNVRIVSAYLDRLTACPGFADAMRTVGWLDGRDGNLTFPGYETHNGETAKRRAVETKRKRAQRDKRPANDGTNVPNEAGLEKRREDVVSITQNGRAHEIPTVDQVKAYAASAPTPISEACAVAFHDTQQAAGWITKHGHSIADWRAALRRYAAYWNENEKAKGINGSLSPRGNSVERTDHRRTKAESEYPEPKGKLPRL